MRFEGTVSCWNVFPKVPAPLARRGDSPALAQGLKVVFASAQGAEKKVLKIDRPLAGGVLRLMGPQGPAP